MELRKQVGWSFLWVLFIGVIFLTGCASKSASTEETRTLKIGAASIPHAEILAYVEEDLAKEGIEVEVSIVSDGIQTNQQTADGQLDANFFQHTPYLNQVNKDSGLELVNVAGVHIEPFGVYSNEIASIDDLSKGAKVSIPKDPVNFSRALELFAANGVIELKEDKDGDFILQDIVKNEKDLEFIAVDSALLVHSLEDVEAAAINTNYALEGGFVPMEDALIMEDSDSPYVNILVTDEKKEKDEAIQTLASILRSDKVKEFIQEEYKGAVVPAF